PGGSDQGQRVGALWQRRHGRCGQPDFAPSCRRARARVSRQPFHLGATDVSMFLASPLSSHWSASLLGGADFQEHRDVDGDGWADLAGYSRGVIRPRFFWDDKNGRSALLTGGITYEDRSGGTVSGAAIAATGKPYTG